MITFEDIKPRSKLSGVDTSGVITVVSSERYGEQAVKIIFEDVNGKVNNRIIYKDDCSKLELVSEGRFWTFNADGQKLRLAVEANRIRLAYHFDPYLAIHTSLVDALPHQITAVYGEMLARQPLRFLLADDPGAGKTIMSGLLIKELIARGDLERCLVVAPGSLVEQWQDELGEKFNLEFDILTNEMIQSSRSGNPFNDRNHLIARLDVLSRNEELQEKLQSSNEWDIVIVDEAHRMSASFFGGEVKYTKRYQLGQKLGQICRHLLLMSATPHNGKDEDFQLFMALLDGDRFEGKFRDGVHVADTHDMMRRLTKEELLKFNGKPLFPERRAYTVRYQLSDLEASLYAAVTEYVRSEMNRVDRFTDIDNKKRVNVGFALQILQRRLASSPAAIYNSLKRRRERLENELTEARLIARGQNVSNSLDNELVSDEIFRNMEEYDQDEIDNYEDNISTSATTAETIEQLEQEVETLKSIEAQAAAVLRSGTDTKWRELDKILDDDIMIDEEGVRRKLIVFTEARDTLVYLVDKIRTRLGKSEVVDCIHGGILREERRKVIRRFMQDKDLIVLVANDAAGEGVNLQRGNLMVNYDLPWNPNKIEQRFGRIHRIGQTEVCHLWNIVAAETREGEVYARLLEKLEAARAALHGQVFDVLGDLFDGKPLKDLLWEAIQYGEREEVKNRLDTAIDGVVDVAHIKKIMDERKLTNDVMPEKEVQDIRLDMERAEAQRLQPHHIQSFFIEAFKHLGGNIKQREEGRFEIINVPVRIRERDRLIGIGTPIGKKYERICFDKKNINHQPIAEFVCPGHPLLETVISIIHEDYNHLLRQGAIMVDESDMSHNIQVIFLVEHEINDGRKIRSGNQQTISKKLQFARLSSDGSVDNGGIAPHLNLRPIKDEEINLVSSDLSAEWLQGSIEEKIKEFAVINLAQTHLKEIKDRRLPEIDKVEKEVEARLKQEIRYWDSRAVILKEEEKAGKRTRVSWQNAERRAEELSDRLQRRMLQLKEERTIVAAPPTINGGLVVIPQGLLSSKLATNIEPNVFAANEVDRKEVEIAAMNAVMSAENDLGNKPEDISSQKVGYDILSYDPNTNKHRFIEVKGRSKGAETVTVTRNEIITALNKPDDYILAIVSVEKGKAHEPRYRWKPFLAEPSFDTVSINFNLHDLLENATPPQ